MVTALAALALPGIARAQRVDPLPPLNTTGTAVPLDGVRPAVLPGSLRSLRAPVAVHLAPGVPAALGVAALATAERACDGLEFILRLPLPLSDGTHGGGSDVDVYITPDGPTVDTVVDALDDTSPWDSASAFVRVRAVADPVAFARAVTEGIAQAAVRGANADPPATVVRALGASIAGMITGLPEDPAAVRAFQREPWRAMFSDQGVEAGRGAGIVVDHILRRWDDDRHGLLGDLVWASVQHTPGDSPRLWDEPDVFDVARRLFRTEPGGVPGMLLDTAIDRALAGTPASEDRLGDLDDPTLAAVPMRALSWRDLPVQAEAPRPLDVLGMASVTLDLADAPLGASVSLWLHAGPYSHWVASVVRVGRDGRVAGRADSGVITDGTWSAEVEALDGVTRVVVVAVDLGVEDYEPDVPTYPDGFLAVHLAPSH